MLNILTAHQGEAQPLINHFDLQADRGDGLTVYSAEAVSLVVTGEGLARAHDATERLLGLGNRGESPLWLNFGLAGSAEFAIGSLVVIPGVCSDLAHRSGLPISSFVSAASPSEIYPERGIVDMELDAIQELLENAEQRWLALKLVSDGPDRGLESLDRSAITALLRARSAAVCSFSDMLQRSY